MKEKIIEILKSYQHEIRCSAVADCVNELVISDDQFEEVADELMVFILANEPEKKQNFKIADLDAWSKLVKEHLKEAEINTPFWDVCHIAGTALAVLKMNEKADTSACEHPWKYVTQEEPGYYCTKCNHYL
jgi:hypothetical protein